MGTAGRHGGAERRAEAARPLSLPVSSLSADAKLGSDGMAQHNGRHASSHRQPCCGVLGCCRDMLGACSSSGAWCRGTGGQHASARLTAGRRGVRPAPRGAAHLCWSVGTLPATTPRTPPRSARRARAVLHGRPAQGGQLGSRSRVPTRRGDARTAASWRQADSRGCGA